VIFDVLHQPAEPGIGAMVDHGPGTFWECWWIDPDNTGTGSLDHIGLGGPFASWAWQDLAGVRPLASGYARFSVAPHFVSGIDSLSLDTETINGPVHLDYRRSADRMRVSIGVPVGAEAVVELPGMPSHTATSGMHEYELAWPTMEASRSARPGVPWQPPPAAPVPSDLANGTNLLESAVAEGRCRVRGGRFEVLSDGIACMPVPHAQEPGPVLRVIANATEPDIVPPVRLEFDHPLSLEDAAFAYAMVDPCADAVTRPVETFIVLYASDGSHLDASDRFWPAGWNRVAVDIDAWPGRFAVVAIEAGIRYTDREAEPTARTGPPTFHLGAVGYSTDARTW
jgi:alpha-L-rhamnosidase